jgi:PAS domain S-box-containing protein
MESYQQEIAQIQEILKQNPKGMTVTDISRKIKINRNSVAKYLDIMRISGLVEMITFGPAKVFFPSKRVPISDMINYTSDYILTFDSKMKITMINNAFLNFLKVTRENIIGESIQDIILQIFKENSELLVGINEALEGKNYRQEIDFKLKNELYFLIVKIIPTTFEDGRQGVTLILKNNTDRRIAENVLRESEENFRNLLKKMNKK